MKTRFLYLCGILTLFAGCSQNDLPTGDKEDAGDIRATARTLTMNAGMQADTRTAYISTDATGLKAMVLASQTKDNYGTAYAKGTMTFGPAAVGYEDAGFTGNKQLPANKSSVYLCALYPVTGPADWTVKGTTADYTFSGTQDVMAAAQTEVAKGGTGDGSNSAAATASFAFKHLLTKLDIKVKAASTEAIDAWGNVCGITVTKVTGSTSFGNSVSVTLSDATAAMATAFSGTEPSWPVFTAYAGSTADEVFTGKSLELTTTATTAGTTMLAPFMATNAVTDLELAVVTKSAGGSDYMSTVKVKIPAGDTQGNAYTVTLNFNATTVNGGATVGDWTQTDAGEVTIN